MIQQRSPSLRRWISNLLFVVAAVLFAYVAYAWYQDRSGNSIQIPTPQSEPGQAEVKNVHDAIEAQGATMDYGRQTVRVDDLEPVGQQLMVDGVPVYVFIFEIPRIVPSKPASSTSMPSSSRRHPAPMPPPAIWHFRGKQRAGDF